MSESLLSEKFWETKSLKQMTGEEWEALCDGCGKCCLHKLQDIDTDTLAFTYVACRLLDLHTTRCKNYDKRRILVPDCVRLTPKTAHKFNWLPVTCAYRLLSEGKPLPDWHYLICGDREAVHAAGMSARGRAVSEDEVIDYEDHIAEWDDL